MPARSVRRAVYVVSGLERFYSRHGVLDAELSAPVIEAFCSGGLGALVSSTKGTYRSVPRRLSEDAPPKGAPGFAGSLAAPPYSVAERAELYSIARLAAKTLEEALGARPHPLSMGAGLRAGEVISARRSDVVGSLSAVGVAVQGTQSTVVPVVGEEAAVLVELSRPEGGRAPLPPRAGLAVLPELRERLPMIWGIPPYHRLWTATDYWTRRADGLRLTWWEGVGLVGRTT